jgi:hypothetical protein
VSLLATSKLVNCGGVGYGSRFKSSHGLTSAWWERELEVSGEDLSGGVVLKTDESEFGAAAFEPIMTAGIGKRHHAKAWAGRPAGAVLTRSALLRRRRFRGPQVRRTVSRLTVRFSSRQSFSAR